MRSTCLCPAPLICLFCCLALNSSYGQAKETPGPLANQTKTNELIVEPPTLLCAGFQWTIDGDANRNATVDVQFRKKGSAEWQTGQPLLRSGGEKIYGHDQRWVYTTEHMFAGSIFNLDPATVYECRLQLKDPDGIEGVDRHTVFVETKAEPRPYAHGKVYHVYPPRHHRPP